MIFSKLHTSYEQYAECVNAAREFIITTAKNNNLTVENPIILDAKNYPKITLFSQDMANSCVIRYLDVHYLIESFKLSSQKQFEFLDAVKATIEEINKELDKK